MASIKLSLLSAISGRIESAEYAMTRNGVVAKHRKPPRRLDRPKQIEARTVFARRISDWHTMTDAAKTEWNAYASSHPVTNRLGQSKYITGFNWFLKLRDTDDGILLPFGTAPPLTLGPPQVWFGGPYTFPITWPPESTDDWSARIWFTHIETKIPGTWVGVAVYAGEYTKANIADLNYATLTALGITLFEGEYYLMRAYAVAPRYFPGMSTFAYFQVLPALLYSFWLKMDDNAPTTTVLDNYTNHDQTFEGTDPNTEDHHVAGVHDGALHFNGTDNKIVLTTASYQDYMDDDQPFTIAIWWKPDAPVSATYKDFLSSAAIGEAGIQFKIKNNKSQIYVVCKWDGSITATSFEWDEDDESIWQHWAFVRDDRTIRMYKNGIKALEVTSDFWQGKFYTVGRALSIGCQRGGYVYAAGAADDVRLFNSALSDAEVLALATP